MKHQESDINVDEAKNQLLAKNLKYLRILCKRKDNKNRINRYFAQNIVVHWVTL